MFYMGMIFLDLPPQRALPDITSGLDVRQIFKIRTVRKPDVFLLGRRTFNTFKNRKKNPNFFCQIFFFSIFFFKNLVGKMFKNISPDSVRSGRTCPANLGVRSRPVRKLICPVRLSPTKLAIFYQKSEWDSRKWLYFVNFKVNFLCHKSSLLI